MAWTEHMIEALKRLWNADMPANRIVEELGGVVSRNAVISKANRLGLAPRGSPIPESLHISVTRKLHMRLHQQGLSTGSREAIIEAFAFTETGTPIQIARALAVPIEMVEAASEWLEERYGAAPAAAPYPAEAYR